MNEFIIKNGYFSQGSSNVTGSLTVTAGVTASLQGTASFATSASRSVSSSFATTAQTASYVLNAVSASFATSASRAVSASFAPNIYNSNGILNTSRQLDLNGASLDIFGNTGIFNVNIDDTLSAGQLSVTNGAAAIGVIGGYTGKNLSIDPSSISLDGKLIVYASKTTSTQPLEGTTINLSDNLIVTGSVGIGKNTAPSAKLDVSGSALITGSLIVSASGGTNDFQVGTNKLFVSASGNVGIGITSSAAKLHVNNTGTGNSFLVEDSANPDTTPFVIDNAGRVLIGGLTPLDFVLDNSNSTASLYVKGNPSFGPSTDYAMYINGNNCDVGLGITYGYTPTTTGIYSSATTYGGKFQASNQGAVTIYGIFAESTAYVDEFSSPLDVAVGGFFNATQAVNGIGNWVQVSSNNINTGSLIQTFGASTPSVGIQNHTGGGYPNLGIRNEVIGDAATGSYTTVSGSSSGMVGDIISVTGPGSNYALQLQDGTEGAGKVLVSQTATGKANWSTRLSGSYGLTGSLNMPSIADPGSYFSKIHVANYPIPDGSLTNGTGSVLYQYGDNNEGLILQYGNGGDEGGIKITDDGVAIFGSADTDILKVIDEDTNVQRFSINDTGQVGINKTGVTGSSTPTNAILDVNGDTIITGSLTVTGNVSSNGDSIKMSALIQASLLYLSNNF